MKRKIFMKISQDKYELPVAITDSVNELSRITGDKMTTIYKNIDRYMKGLMEKPKYIKIIYNNDED